jgi:hypothetical protein
VFEGERCEAKQKQKLTREENGKERTLKHQQRGYPIFSELSHHLSRYRQKPPQLIKRKKSKHLGNIRWYLFRKSHRREREGTPFYINKEKGELVVRLDFFFLSDLSTDPITKIIPWTLVASFFFAYSLMLSCGGLRSPGIS